MRIASVTNTPLDPSLGSGKTVLSWSEGLRDKGHHVDVFSPDMFYKPLHRQRVRRLKLRWDACSLVTPLRNGNYDLVEFYGGEFGWLTKKLTSMRPRPLLVAHTNGLELLANETKTTNSPFTWNRFLKWPVDSLIQGCDRLAFTKVDRFAAICELDVEYITTHKLQLREHTLVVEPGIDHEFLNSNWDEPKEHRIAYLGSWSERKDPVTLSSVLRKLLHEDPLLNVDLMGCWNNRNEVVDAFPIQFRARLHVHPHLEKSEMVNVLERAKVFLFPSLYEGFGMATAEAMACGCAAVVTPTGFGGSLVNDTEALVRPFQDVDKLSDAARQLLSNRVLRDNIAQAGRKRVSELTWSRQVDRLDAAYRQWTASNEVV